MMKMLSGLYIVCVMFFAANIYAVELSFYVGEVSVIRGSEKMTKLSQGERLKTNDVIKTGKKSTATVCYPDGSEIKLSENTAVKIGQVSDKGAPVTVQNGSIVSKFTKLSKDSFERRKIYTPTTVAAVRGTEFKVIVSDTAASRVELSEGTLDVYNPTGSSQIKAGTSVEADAAMAPVKSDKAAVSESEWMESKDSEFDADVPEKGKRFKQQTDDFSSRGNNSKKKIDELKREIREKKDKEALEKTGDDLDKEAEVIEDDYYLSDASSQAIDRITNRFAQDKKKMRSEFEKLKRESNKVREQQRRNYEAIQAVKESYRKAFEAIKTKYGEDKQKIKGDVDLDKVKPQINK